MKREEKKTVSGSNEKTHGIISFIFSINSIVFSFAFPLGALIIGILGLVFGIVQDRISKNSWSQWGKILSIIGIILNIAVISLVAYYLSTRPELLPIK